MQRTKKTIYQVYELTGDVYNMLIKVHIGTAKKLKTAKELALARWNEIQSDNFFLEYNFIYQGMTKDNPIVVMEKLQKEVRWCKGGSFGGLIVMKDELL